MKVVEDGQLLGVVDSTQIVEAIAGGDEPADGGQSVSYTGTAGAGRRRTR